MATTDVFEYKWKELRDHIRPHWIALTEDDVARVNGKLDVLIELLREKYGLAPLQAEAEVNRFIQELGVAMPLNPN